MLIEFHVLQNHVPSNLNRDDLGAPKTAYFGKTLRARISSQCQKRVIRHSASFKEGLADYIGTRTKMFPALVEKVLENGDLFPDKCERENLVVACTRIADDKEIMEADDRADARPHTGQLIFLGPKEVEAFVKALARLKDAMPTDYKRFLKKGEAKVKDDDNEKKEKGKKKDNEPSGEFWADLRKSYDGHAVDIALFGRMTTSNAFQNVEACMEVAHAISTHEVLPEVDYFTAMDDQASKQQTGSAHIGENQMNSATYYKYFSLDWDAFTKALGGDKPDEKTMKLASEALSAFIRAAIEDTPSGKRKGHAHNNLPDAVLVEIKERKVATNYANAFLKPADPGTSGDLMETSIRMLDSYAKRTVEGFNIKSEKQWFSATYPSPEMDGGEAPLFTHAKKSASLNDLIAWTLDTVKRGGKK